MTMIINGMLFMIGALVVWEVYVVLRYWVAKRELEHEHAHRTRTSAAWRSYRERKATKLLGPHAMPTPLALEATAEVRGND